MAQEWTDTASYDLAKKGLVVVGRVKETPDESDCLYVIRPASAGGKDFGWGNGVMFGVGRTTVLTNAPPATIVQTKTGHRVYWTVDISIPAAPGPGPVYLHENCAELGEAVEAILRGYFGGKADPGT